MSVCEFIWEFICTQKGDGWVRLLFPQTHPHAESMLSRSRIGEAFTHQSSLLSFFLSLLVSEAKSKREIYFPVVIYVSTPPIGGRRSCSQIWYQIKLCFLCSVITIFTFFFLSFILPSKENDPDNRMVFCLLRTNNIFSHRQTGDFQVGRQSYEKIKLIWINKKIRKP